MRRGRMGVVQAPNANTNLGNVVEKGTTSCCISLLYVIKIPNDFLSLLWRKARAQNRQAGII
jgi:hypothetical protein